MKQASKFFAAALTSLAIGGCALSEQGAGAGKAAMPFGGPSETAYAAQLWRALEAARLIGSEAVQTKPYTGQHPHGAVLQNIESTLEIDDQVGVVLVKRNYGGEGVSIESVSQEPDRYLESITVMYQRAGYDPDNNDWFWVKYLPDGSLDKNSAGLQLAGRVGKDGEQGCIPCHSAAPGGDKVFTHNRYASR